jgi:starch phosphorylase
MDRVVRLLGDPERPVQLVFAGKAHPQDEGGKDLIKAIVAASRDPSLAGRVVFLEDYDMGMARALVSGVDVWLNTPRRPHEASGTSGMKAAANGALNVSILDGWWAEAFARHGSDVGWAIGRGEEYAGDEARGDEVEAELLYEVLEREVVPLFFDRDKVTGLPRGWIQRMKAAIAHLVPEFNTARMVKEYSERFYVPALAGASSLLDDDLSIASELVSWKERIRAAWPAVAVRRLQAQATSEVTAGDSVRVEANVHLGTLAPEDVVVELYFGVAMGALDLHSNRGSWCSRLMRSSGGGPDGTFTFVGEIPTSESGAHAFTARVMPFNPAMTPPRLDASLVRWA